MSVFRVLKLEHYATTTATNCIYINEKGGGVKKKEANYIHVNGRLSPKPSCVLPINTTWWSDRKVVWR